MEQPIFREIPEGAQDPHQSESHGKVPLTEAIAGDLQRQAEQLQQEDTALTDEALELDALLEKTEGQINQAKIGGAGNGIPEDLNGRTLDLN